jgi:hypothetical protein
MNEAEKIDKPQGNGVLPCVSGSCFWGHKWTKWKQQNIDMILVKQGQQYPYVGTIQTRYCLRCGKMQKDEI